MTKTLARVRRAGRFVEIRMRIARAIRVLPPLLAGGLAVAAVLLAVHKVFPARLDAAHTRLGFEIVGALAGLAALVALAWRIPPKAGTMALDRHYRLHDKLTSALEFEALPESERTAFMQAAIEDAARDVSTVRASKVAPIFAVIVGAVFSVEALLAVLGAGGLVGVSFLEIRTLVPDAPKPQQKPLGIEMDKDDIAELREEKDDLQRPNQSPEMQAAIERFNRLIEDLDERRLDRAEAFRQTEEIERDLDKSIDADQDKLKKELAETSKDLSQSEKAKDIAEALAKNDLEKAKDKMKELADELRDKKKPLDKDAKARLEKALREAASRRKDALDALEKERSKLRERLLQRRHDADNEKDPQKKDEKERLLKKDERELERLDRDSEDQARSQGELSKLDKDLAQAAEDLMKEEGLSAKDLDEAAEDINRLDNEQMSDKDKEKLKERLEDLREKLRQQGQGGKNRQSRMRKFSKAARGGQGKQRGNRGDKGQKGQQGKDGQQGDSGDQQGDEQGDAKDGDGQDGDDGDQGDGDKPGQKGKNGHGGKDGDSDGSGGIQFSKRRGAGGIPMPGDGSDGDQGDPAGGSSSGQNGGQDGPNHDGGGQGGHSWGTEAGGPVAGKATDPKMGTQDVHQDGQDTGQGSSNERAILVAAEKGFRGSSYKQVFTKYRTKVEESMNKEEVPDGFRFYVKRYFQLIRPGDDE